MAEIAPGSRNMREARALLDQVMTITGPARLIELLRDITMHRATSSSETATRRRELWYYTSKALEGALGLAKEVERVEEPDGGVQQRRVPPLRREVLQRKKRNVRVRVRG